MSRVLSVLTALCAVGINIGLANAATPAWKAGNSCGNATNATTLVCNIRSDGLAVVSGDAVVVALAMHNTTNAIVTTAASTTTTLTFASVPSAIAAGQFVGDLNTPSALAVGTTVVSKTATTVTITPAAINVGNGDSITFTDASISDDKGDTYTLVDSAMNLNSSIHQNVQVYRALNVTTGPTQITVTYPANDDTKSLIMDEYFGLNAVDAHTINQQALVAANPVTSGSVNTTAADLVWGVTFNDDAVATITPGSGFTQRESTVFAGGYSGMSEDMLQTSSGLAAAKFMTSSTDDYITAIVAFTPASTLPVPTAISCAATSMPDNSASGTVVCAFTVTMSDGSTYSGGANTITPALFNQSSSTGNGNITIGRALNGITDDGAHVMTVTAAKNGVTVTQNFTLTVTPVSVTGNPYSVGWKNIDPGASSTDGAVVFTAPRTMTVNEIAMRVVTPATGIALVDVYKASPGTACISGSKLHTSDLNAAGASDHVQTVPLVSANTSLAIYDSVCLVTQQPFSTTGQATVTVTAN